ncbi:hypothetical protein [Rhizobium ruizarguesonis]|uniref:hypothetical protein n=1 Tax=Rhizobium ruizarguesonis TaxID=2081791 RepID=UPI001031EA9D|nr:hypothetical protein [Rhizobium ruizarguesonis]TAW18454.1 hypothetical protein ELI25_22975 [Rhizobium ruizarguesonis]TAZ54037.1 hypothetical protein ELH76_24205 [Rhizobium ruizarguesonis]
MLIKKRTVQQGSLSMTEKLTGSAARAAIIKAGKANRAEAEKVAPPSTSAPIAVDRAAMWAKAFNRSKSTDTATELTGAASRGMDRASMWARAMKAAAELPPPSDMDAN